MPNISIVIPVYNSAATLPELHRRLTAAAAGLGEYEIILVDDGSRDSSWLAIENLARGDSRVLGLRMGRNYGHTRRFSPASARRRAATW